MAKAPVFSVYRKQIETAILSKSGELGINEPVTLLEGFVNFSLLKESFSGLVVGGPHIPTVAIVGNRTGRVFFFALKVLIPDIDKENDSSK